MAGQPKLELIFATNKNPYGSESYGGAEASCRLLAEQLATRGHRATYFTHRVSSEQAKTAAAAGVSLRPLPTRSSAKGWRPSRTWRSAASIGRFLAHRRVDIAYCFYEPNIMRSLVWANLVSPRTKIVMQMAGQHWYESCLRNRKNVLRYRRLFEKIDCVNYVDATLESVTRRRLNELGMPVTFKCAFTGEIGSGVFARKAGLKQFSENPFRIIMAARFADYSRRQDLLIKAMSFMPLEADIELTLAGDGVRRAECERMVADLNLEKRVRFEPFLPQSNLWDLLQQCHLLTHCAEHEGLGKIVIEAMALGLPVLASNVPVINGYIVDGDNGFLVSNDPRAWVRRIVELQELRDARQDVSVRARQFAQAHHCPQKNVLLYEEQFFKLARTAQK